MKDQPFKHCSACGSTELTARSHRESQCLRCGYRHFVTTIPAACALILDDRGRVLISRRAHESGLGRLCVPGGVIEDGETGEEACARETREEMGLAIAPSAFRYLVSLPNQYLFQGYVWPTLDLFYVARVASFDQVTIQASEVQEWLAMSLDAVVAEDFAFASNVEALRCLRKSLS